MRRLLALACLLLSIGGTLQAQACTATNVATCSVNGNATRSVTVGVGYVARLLLSTSTVTLPTPGIPQFDALYTGNGTFGLIVRANTPWRVSLRASAATWTGVPLSARQNKPVGDLEWSLLPGSGFAAMTTTLASVSTGTATGGTNLTVYLRSKLSWTLDAAGAYTLPLEVTITSP